MWQKWWASRSNDTIFEGYADTKEGKGKGKWSLYSRKMQRPRKVGWKDRGRLRA